MWVDLIVVLECMFIPGILCTVLQLKAYVEEWFTARRIAIVGVGKLCDPILLSASHKISPLINNHIPQ